jgi:hypothetical protein
MKRLTAALLAMPLILSGTAFAESGPDDHGMDAADWHREMCTDRYAHEFAKTAYLEARLGITDKQQAAWDAWQKVENDSAAKERDACLTMAPKKDRDESILDQEAHTEMMLSQKLDELHASRPALEALYAELTTDQKEEFDHFGEWHNKPHPPEMNQKGHMDGGH